MTLATLIGCGRIGELHARILQKKGIKITSLFDISKKNLTNFQKKLNLHNVEIFNKKSNYFNYLKKETPNIAIVSTTTLGRAEIIKKFIKIGIPKIFSEKPLCSSMLEINQINTLLKNYKTDLAVNHHMRYLPQYTRIKELVNEPRFGGLLAMHVVGGNFGLAMNGSHYIEAFRYLTDDYSESVTAFLDSEKEFSPRGEIFKDAAGLINVISSKKYLLTINCSNKNYYGMNATYVCKYGIINVDELSGHLYGTYRKEEFKDFPSYRYGMPAEKILETITAVEVETPTTLLLEDLLSNKNYPKAKEAFNAIKTIIASYHSSRRKGKSIKLSDINKNNKEIFKWA